jgi:glycosyltransferase involved in cell wall biosynthesis
MEKSPLVSIITVVYNGEKYLQQTIDSVRNQTYTNIEYIIIDGGSTDRTIDIIKKNRTVISKWVSEPDHGLYDAMNKGIKMASGELIGMINSDDWYELKAVEIIIGAFIENPHKKIFHADRYDIINSAPKKIRKFNPSIFKLKYIGMTYNHPSMFFHREIYSKRLYNTNLRSLSDFEFVLKEFIKDSNVFFYIPVAYVNYRLDGISGNLGFIEALKEGYKARKNARLNVTLNCISFVLRATLLIYNYIKKNGTNKS